MSDAEQAFTLTTPEKKRAFLSERGWKGVARQLDNVERVYHEEHGFMTLEDAYSAHFRLVAS